MTPSPPATTATLPTVYAVWVADDESDDLARIFASQEAVDLYAARRPEKTYVAPYQVDDEAPEVRVYVEVIFLLGHYRRGLRWWTGATEGGPATAEDVHILLRSTFDTDAVPAHIKDVPVDVEFDLGSGLVKVCGTDEQAVRETFVTKVREMLATAPEERS